MNKYLVAVQKNIGYIVNLHVEVILSEGRQAAADFYIEKHDYKHYKNAIVVLAEIIDGKLLILDGNVTYGQTDMLINYKIDEPTKYLVALSCGGGNGEGPHYYSGPWDVIEAESQDDARKIYNEKHNANYYTGSVVAIKENGFIRKLSEKIDLNGIKW